MNKHIKMPSPYRNTNGIASAIMLVTSAGVSNIDNQRERLVQVAAAPGSPFDHGQWEIVAEPFDA